MITQQNLSAFKNGMEGLGATQIELFENGMKFIFDGVQREETYQQCMIYILNGNKINE
jgi:hypothetical protein